MSSAAAHVFSAVQLGFRAHRHSFSDNKYAYSCPPPSQAVAGDGSSSSSRIVSHISENGSQMHISAPRYKSRLIPGGSISSRGGYVSTSVRTANVCFRSRSNSRASSSSSSGKRQSKSIAGSEVLPALNPKEAKSGSFVSRDQSLEAPSPYPKGDGNLELPPLELGDQQGNEGENSLRTMEEIVATVAQQSEATEETVVRFEDPSLPTMDDIVAAAAQDGIKLQVKSFGLTFQILVTNLDETQVFGKADGWIKWWWPKGKILHLESVKLDRGLSKQVGNVFGAGFFVGASTLRYGFDQGCRTAELLAIYDDEVTHGKLVKYYSRLGFKTLYEVNEEEMKYFPDRVVWGGVGTRMDADCEELLRKWRLVLKPKAKLRSGLRSKGFS